MTNIILDEKKCWICNIEPGVPVFMQVIKMNETERNTLCKECYEMQKDNPLVRRVKQ